MCKKLVLIVLTLMISLSAHGCAVGYFSDRDMDIYEKIHKHYSNMNGYSAVFEFDVFSNKTERHYIANQKTLSPDKFYTKVKSENSGLSVTTITNGKKTKTLTEGSDYFVTVPTAEHLGLLFVNRFFSTYYGSEETALTVSRVKDGKVTVLETDLSALDTVYQTATLSIDNKTLAPVELTLKDEEGNTLLRGTYKDFKYNDKTLKDSIFSVT